MRPHLVVAEPSPSPSYEERRGPAQPDELVDAWRDVLDGVAERAVARGIPHDGLASQVWAAIRRAELQHPGDEGPEAIHRVLDGRFSLGEKVGAGGMATVYRAFDLTLERWVAIKLMNRAVSTDPDQQERFRREARAAARLNHPNVVTVIDAGEDDGAPYIVFEYVDGETLKDRIRRLGRVPVLEAVTYGIAIGRGLSSAHSHRLVHRDVKPQNVLIDPDGHVKLTDFGIACWLDLRGLTATGRVLGTTDYISPEQAIGQNVTEQSDVYSLGTCLYEMLTGEVPFHAETQVAVALKHVQEPLPDVQRRRPEVSAAVAAVIERSTAKELRNRYATVHEMVNDLEQALAVESARAGGAARGSRTLLRALPAQTGELAPATRAHSWRGLASLLSGHGGSGPA